MGRYNVGTMRLGCYTNPDHYLPRVSFKKDCCAGPESILYNVDIAVSQKTKLAGSGYPRRKTNMNTRHFAICLVCSL